MALLSDAARLLAHQVHAQRKFPESPLRPVSLQTEQLAILTFTKFRKLRPSELPLGHETGTGLTSVVINPMVYLPYLVGQLRHAGVVLKRAVVSHIADSVALHHSGKRADAVVNCTGLMARRLGGVEDPSVYPGRGQVVVVRNDPGYMIASSGVDGAGDECVYVMTRAAGECPAHCAWG